MTGIQSFLDMLFIGVIALFPVVNPIGSAFIVNPFLSNLSAQEKRKAVTKITLYAFTLCTISFFAGHWILQLFGITIPIVQLAGGIMICKIGWELLSSDKKNEKVSAETDLNENSNYSNVKDNLFYPITFPITTGAGSLSVLFTLSAHSADKHINLYLINTAAILLAIIMMCVLIYFFFLNTKKIIRVIGPDGEKILNRIIAFLIFCVGLQIAVTGIKSLI
ncbi:inner membrane protein [compost metagenome]